MTADVQDQESQETAKKRGRKTGTPKTGGAGHYAPDPGLKGAPLRAWMLSQSGAIETLVRLSKGRAIKLHGPTGKITWHYPSPEQVLWAVERVLRKALPDKQTESAPEQTFHF